MLLTAFVAVSLAGCAAAPVVSGEQQQADAENKQIVVKLEKDDDESAEKITVSANGTVKVTPDVAYTTVGVVTQKKKMQDAQASNKELMNAVVASLKEAGLTDEDIRTTNYSVSPVYDYSGDTSRIASFEVYNTVELTIRDIDGVGEILDAAAVAGANTSYSITFDILDKEPYYNQALTAAMESARTKAGALAEAGGFTVGKVSEVTEGYTYNAVYREYPAADEMAESGTYVSAGDMDVTASITVVFEIA